MACGCAAEQAAALQRRTLWVALLANLLCLVLVRAPPP